MTGYGGAWETAVRHECDKKSKPKSGEKETLNI